MTVDQAPPSATTALVPTLPGTAYTSPEVFAREQELIFGRQWTYAGRSDAVAAAGDFLRTDVAGQSVIVVRARDGGLRAYRNTCRHRGSQLCLTESGSVGRAIRCPYHAWAYRIEDGGLITAPNFAAMADVDTEPYRLAAVGVEEWQGLVWVTLDPEHAGTLAEQLAPQLAYRLGEDVDRVDRYGMAELRVGASVTYDCAANWKIIVENFQECYHCGTIHPELVAQVPTFASFEELAGGEYHTGGYAFAPEREGFSASGTRTLPVLPGLLPTDDQRYLGMVLRPNAFVSLVPDHVIVHRFVPLAPDRTLVVCEWLFRPEVLADDRYDTSDAVALFDAVNRQDLDASAWCQPGMSSPVYRDGGVLVPTESAIIADWFYPWYRRAMGL